MNEENQNFFDMIARVSRKIFKEEFNNHDRTVKGAIVAVNSDNTVNVRIDGEIYENIKSRNNLLFQMNDIVYVKYPSNNAGEKIVTDNMSSSNRSISSETQIINSIADPFVGEVKEICFDNVPNGWMLCDGRILNVTDYPDLYAVIGNTYGGDGKNTFALPTIKSKVLVGSNSSVSSNGEDALATMQPLAKRHYIIAGKGIIPCK